MENRKWKTGNVKPANAELRGNSAMAGFTFSISGFRFSIFFSNSDVEARP